MSVTAHLFLPVGLGLLGFVEPCAIGSHMVVLGALAEQSRASRAISLLIFVMTRAFTFGVVGVVVGFIGQHFIAGQKAFWTIFGVLYVALGMLYLAGKAGVIARVTRLGRHRKGYGPGKAALGRLFGLSVPACAAPLLFAVAAGAAGSAEYVRGFATMNLFGLALSAPLLLVAAIPKLSQALEGMRNAPKWVRRTIGVLLFGMGLWSVWFGLFVNPYDWQLP
jgi:cytochrome c-type biogenesis protein